MAGLTSTTTSRARARQSSSIHGFSLDGRMWDEQVVALRDVATVIRCDLRGFGRSSEPSAGIPYTHSADLLALLDRLGIDSAVFVGLSMGGRVVLETALVAPKRVRGLVLLDSVLNGVDWDAASEQGMEDAQRAATTGDVRGESHLARHPPSLRRAATRNWRDVSPRSSNRTPDSTGRMRIPRRERTRTRSPCSSDRCAHDRCRRRARRAVFPDDGRSARAAHSQCAADRRPGLRAYGESRSAGHGERIAAQGDPHVALIDGPRCGLHTRFTSPSK